MQNRTDIVWNKTDPLVTETESNLIRILKTRLRLSRAYHGSLSEVPRFPTLLDMSDLEIEQAQFESLLFGIYHGFLAEM